MRLAGAAGVGEGGALAAVLSPARRARRCHSRTLHIAHAPTRSECVTVTDDYEIHAKMKRHDSCLKFNLRIINHNLRCLKHFQYNWVGTDVL